MVMLDFFEFFPYPTLAQYYKYVLCYVNDIYSWCWAYVCHLPFCHMCSKLHVQDNLVISKAVV